MVARTPQKQMKVVMVAPPPPPLNSDLLRETINKVDKCMERLQELQYTITGGTKVVSGVNLSPRSTRSYLKTSLRCKQETLRIKNATSKKSPVGKFPASSPGDWRKMSLPAMLLGETVNEILQASQVTRDIVEAIAPKKTRKSRRSIMPEEEEEEEEECPKTPETQQKPRKPDHDNVRSNIKARRKKEKQNKRSESDSPPSLQRIAFKFTSPQKLTEKGIGQNSFRANRVSPKHKPWTKKAVLFPNPLFISGTATQQARNDTSRKETRETPHKFLIKSPNTSASKFQVKIKSPLKFPVSPTRNGTNLSRKSPPSSSSSPTRIVSLRKKSSTASISPIRNLSKKSPKLSTAAKLRRSFTPTRNGSNFAISPKRITLRALISPTRNDNLGKKSPKHSISPTRVSMKHKLSTAAKLKKSPKLSTTAKLRRSFTPTRTGSNFAISPKRITLQALISPTRNDNLGKKSPKHSISPTRVSKKSHKLSTAAKLRRSFSPSRLAMRLVSPMKNRKSVGKCDDDKMEIVSGLKQRPVLIPKRFSMGRI